MKNEEARGIASAALRLFRTALRGDYSYSGDSKLRAEVEINLYAAENIIHKAFSDGGQGLNEVFEEIHNFEREIATNEKLGPISREEVIANINRKLSNP